MLGIISKKLNILIFDCMLIGLIQMGQKIGFLDDLNIIKIVEYKMRLDHKI